MILSENTILMTNLFMVNTVIDGHNELKYWLLLCKGLAVGYTYIKIFEQDRV